jgi:DNA-binding transcriptional ArsR family regulator
MEQAARFRDGGWLGHDSELGPTDWEMSISRPTGPTLVIMPLQSEGRRPATLQEMRALASPIRLRIMRLTLDRSLTNKEIAELLRLAPATTLHHVRTLADAGFLAPEPVRRGSRGSRERPYRATRLSWEIDTADVDPAGLVKRASLQAFLAEVGELPPATPFTTTRLGLLLSPGRKDELLDRLGAVLDEFEKLPREPDGEAFAVFAAVYPRGSAS